MPSGMFSFTWVGNPAPPSPTMPAVRAAAVSSFLVVMGGGGAMAGSFSILPSDSTTTAWVSCPPEIMTEVISATVPETEACTGALTAALLSPTTVPTKT